jgi:hypothetical protein
MKISRRKPAHYFDRPQAVPGALSFKAAQLIGHVLRLFDRGMRLGNDRRKARRLWRKLQERAKTGAPVIWRPRSYIDAPGKAILSQWGQAGASVPTGKF